MRVKHALTFLAFTVLACVVGALFNIEHWAGADALLLAAMALGALGSILLVLKLLARPGAKRFLNS
jgi:hypothetical protein